MKFRNARTYYNTTADFYVLCTQDSPETDEVFSGWRMEHRQLSALYGEQWLKHLFIDVTGHVDIQTDWFAQRRMELLASFGLHPSNNPDAYCDEEFNLIVDVANETISIRNSGATEYFTLKYEHEKLEDTLTFLIENTI